MIQPCCYFSFIFYCSIINSFAWISHISLSPVSSISVFSCFRFEATTNNISTNILVYTLYWCIVQELTVAVPRNGLARFQSTQMFNCTRCDCEVRMWLILWAPNKNTMCHLPQEGMWTRCGGRLWGGGSLVEIEHLCLMHPSDIFLLHPLSLLILPVEERYYYLQRLGLEKESALPKVSLCQLPEQTMSPL